MMVFDCMLCKFVNVVMVGSLKASNMCKACLAGHDTLCTLFPSIAGCPKNAGMAQSRLGILTLKRPIVHSIDKNLGDIVKFWHHTHFNEFIGYEASGIHDTTFQSL